MLKRFQSFIKEKELFDPDSKLLLAISAGIDSVVLCDLLVRCTYNLTLAHCNFQLRDSESDQDQSFVEKLAGKYGIPYHIKHFKTTDYAIKNNMSIQMAARNLRYEWFQELIKEKKLDFLLTAHHKGDVVETMLLNMVRGTGISGLHGISEKRGNIIRPLLFCNKDEIISYAKEAGLTWREDSSNNSVKYYRNKIRKQVIPILKDINPNLEEVLIQSSEKIWSVETYFKYEVSKLKSRVLMVKDNAIYIDLIKLQPLVIFPAVLAEILKPFNFSWHDAKEITKILDLESGKKFLSSSHLLVKDREQLVITKINNEIFSTEIYVPFNEGDFNFPGGQLTIKKYPAEDYKISKSSNIGAFDFNLLTFPLHLRNWKQGDEFFPLGLGGKKKLSNYFIDKKIPVNLKKDIYILTSGDKIVWIVGYAIDDRFKITPQTKEVIEFKI